MAIRLNTAEISEISLATAGFFFFFKSVHQPLQAASLQHTSKGQHSSSLTYNVNCCSSFVLNHCGPI